MLLGFKSRFVPYIEDGSKTHTIRAKRKIRPRAGETCHCYTGLRTKGARLLGRWECVRVEDIRIELLPGSEMRVLIDGTELDHGELNELAWRDGFRPIPRCDASRAMGMYWRLVHGSGVFEGDVIHWRFLRGAA